MIVDVRFGEPDLTRWRQRVHRQLHLNLASSRARVHAVRVRLNRQGVTPEARFACEMQARLKDDRRLSVYTHGSNPNVCIADAAARLARTLSRHINGRRIVSGPR
jgi:ribosome-associated translation inhibitor RaiA